MINLSPKARRNLTLLVTICVASVLCASYVYLGTLPELNDGHLKLTSYELSLSIVRLVLWLLLAFVCVSVITRAAFDLLRRRSVTNVPPLIQNVFSIIAYTLLFVFVFRYYFPQVELAALFTTSAVFGVIIGLALQDTLGNFFSGISLHADRPFQIGDVITVGQWSGVVESITWRAVKIRTFQNHAVFVSNAIVAKEHIEVCPHDNVNARIIFFNARYEHPPAQVIRLVRDAVRDAPNVSARFEPVVRVRLLGDSAVDYEIKYWLEDYAMYNDTDALLRQRIWYVFQREDFHFAFPTRTLHIENLHQLNLAQANDNAAHTNGQGKAKDDKSPARRKHDISPHYRERLAAVPLFATLNPDELALLTDAATRRIYAAGESIIRAGDEGSSMFVIHRGAAEVNITKNDERQKLATLATGDFFGEMGLLTGAPRTASVVAAMDEVEVIEIGHDALKPLLENNNALADTLSEIVTNRQTQLAASQIASTISITAASSSVLAAIKGFFKLK